MEQRDPALLFLSEFVVGNFFRQNNSLFVKI